MKEKKIELNVNLKSGELVIGVVGKFSCTKDKGDQGKFKHKEDIKARYGKVGEISNYVPYEVTLEKWIDHENRLALVKITKDTKVKRDWLVKMCKYCRDRSVCMTSGDMLLCLDFHSTNESEEKQEKDQITFKLGDRAILRVKYNAGIPECGLNSTDEGQFTESGEIKDCYWNKTLKEVGFLSWYDKDQKLAMFSFLVEKTIPRAWVISEKSETEHTREKFWDSPSQHAKARQLANKRDRDWDDRQVKIDLRREIRDETVEKMNELIRKLTRKRDDLTTENADLLNQLNKFESKNEILDVKVQSITKSVQDCVLEIKTLRENLAFAEKRAVKPEKFAKWWRRAVPEIHSLQINHEFGSGCEIRFGCSEDTSDLFTQIYMEGHPPMKPAKPKKEKVKKQKPEKAPKHKRVKKNVVLLKSRRARKLCQNIYRYKAFFSDDCRLQTFWINGNPGFKWDEKPVLEKMERYKPIFLDVEARVILATIYPKLKQIYRDLKLRELQQWSE